MSPLYNSVLVLSIVVGTGPFLNWVHENFDSFAAHHGDETMLGFLQEIPRSFVSPCPTRSPLSNMLNPIVSSTAVYPGTVNFPRYPNWNRPGLGNYCPPPLHTVVYNTPPPNLHGFQTMSHLGNPFQITSNSLQAPGFPCNTTLNLTMPGALSAANNGNVGVRNLTPLSRIRANNNSKALASDKGPISCQEEVKVSDIGSSSGQGGTVSENANDISCQLKPIVSGPGDKIKMSTSVNTRIDQSTAKINKCSQNTQKIGSKFEGAFNSFVDNSTGSKCDAESCPGRIKSDIVKFNVSKEVDDKEIKNVATKKNNAKTGVGKRKGKRSDKVDFLKACDPDYVSEMSDSEASNTNLRKSRVLTRSCNSSKDMKTCSSTLSAGIEASSTSAIIKSAKFQTVNAKDHAPVKGMSFHPTVPIKKQVGRPRRQPANCKELVATAASHAKQIAYTPSKENACSRNFSDAIPAPDSIGNALPSECIVTHVSPPKGGKGETNARCSNVNTAVVLPRQVNLPPEMCPSSSKYRNESIYFPLLEDARSITSLSQTLDIDSHCPWDSGPAEEGIQIKREPNEYIVVDDSDEDDVQSSMSGVGDSVRDDSNLSLPTSIPMSAEVMEKVDSLFQNKSLFDKLPHIDVIDGSGDKVTTEDILKLEGSCQDADTDDTPLHLHIAASNDDQSESSAEGQDFDADEELSYSDESLKRCASISSTDQGVKKAKTSQQFQGEPPNYSTNGAMHVGDSLLQRGHSEHHFMDSNENMSVSRTPSSLSHLSGGSMVLDRQRNNMLTYLDLDTHGIIEAAGNSACKEIGQSSGNNELFKLPRPTAEWLAEYKLKQSTKWKETQAEKQYLDANNNLISSQRTVKAVQDKIQDDNMASLDMLAATASELQGAVGGQTPPPDVRPKEYPVRNMPEPADDENIVRQPDSDAPQDPLYYSSAWDDHWPMDNAFPEVTDGNHKCPFNLLDTT